MNAAEFDAWADHHTSYKPGFKTWLREDTGRLSVWIKALKPFSLEACKTASVSIGYDVVKSKLFYSDHMAEIIAKCRDLGRQDHYIEPAVRQIVCSRCSGGGLVSVLPKTHFRAMTTVGDTSKPAELREGTRPKVCAAACLCQHGDRYRYELANGRRAFADFNEKTMIDEREHRSGPDVSAQHIAEAEASGRHDFAQTLRNVLTKRGPGIDLVDPSQLVSSPEYADVF